MPTKLPKKKEYPKVLWYVIKRTPPNPRDRVLIYRKNLKSTITMLRNKLPYDIDEGELDFLADETATRLTEEYCNKVTDIRKVVVETKSEEATTVHIIETSKSFIRWFDNE